MKAALMFSWIVIAFLVSGEKAADEPASVNAPEGWTAESPRDEIRPNFSYQPNGGPNATGCFVMSAKEQSEVMGRWTHTIPVVGGRYFSFRALRKTTGIDNPRRNTMVRITWQDDQGNLVKMGPGNHLSRKTWTNQLSNAQDDIRNQAPPTAKWLTRARYEFPADRGTSVNGWTKVSDVYLAPPDATQAKVELCLRWSRSGEVRWSEVSLEEVAPPESRIVRLATVNFHLGEKSNRQPTVLAACRLHAGLIARAASQQADLVCLTEQLVAKGTG